MRKEISIKEFMIKLNEKGIEHMFFHGGTSELFGVENVKGKKVYLDGDKIVLTDGALTVSGTDWATQEYDKECFISKIKEGMKYSVFTEDALKDIFDIHTPGHIFFKESQGWIEVLGGRKLLG